MRIIKAAKKTDEYITTCNNCGSILGLKRNDLNNSTRKDDAECEDWTYFCGVCSCKNHITETISKLFPWIMEDENDRKLQGDNTLWVNPL